MLFLDNVSFLRAGGVSVRSLKTSAGLCVESAAIAVGLAVVAGAIPGVALPF